MLNICSHSDCRMLMSGRCWTRNKRPDGVVSPPMKKRNQHIAQIIKLSDADRFAVSFGRLDLRRRSELELEIQIPASLVALQRVVVNGEVFHRSGSLPEVVRVAPLKFSDNHFKEVNGLVRNHFYSTTAALSTVADKYGFNHESFRRQYYARGWHGPKKSEDQ